MPALCMVCGATKKTGKVKLFHFAVISQKTSQLREVSKRRRHEWLRVLKKTEEDLAQFKFGHYVCSKHFKSGEPAKVQNVTDPDWIPSLNLGEPNKSATKLKRAKGSRTVIDKSDEPAAANTSIGMEPAEAKPEPQPKAKKAPNPLKPIVEQKDRLIALLQAKLKHHQMNEKSFVNDDIKTQYFTGFATYKCFQAFACTVEPILAQNKFPSITTINMFIMVLTKLRLNLPFAYMALKFETPFEVISEIFESSVRKLADQLTVTWPHIRKIPKFLKEIFGEQLAAIVDVLELQLDFGSGTFQSIKFLIAYSPCGRISFVSKSYSGASNDFWILKDSGILDHLKSSDLILSLRGTLNDEVVKPGGIRDTVYMYAIGKKGMVRVQWNNSLARDLRTNLCGLLDQLASIFEYLNHKQPEIWISDPNVFLSKVVMLCAALRNLMLPA